ncbi:glycoside hydrolase family 19 protein [Paucibacter sp. R3-3]|uniref:Glycoside hydrolase family 19 protein n=1 Tax=Roseateles agri TaxID=3098619 RepID=A0ABU5DQ91_9BURK|nr:glycoside hydrolase family 19 protein [Paucibacter sp. R3-3]MDY0748493.1 glycoside hydrolase family 19 protein [Paucibacter sp. R3-3]
MLIVQTLIAAGLGPTLARDFAEPLHVACDRFQISTPIRQAAFVSQAMHESARFTRLEEDLFYTTPERIRQIWPTRVSTMADAATLIRNPQGLANRVYANRNGNADEGSGDGWTYRGRGIFQLTGRANYLAAGDALGAPLKEQPDLVARPVYATLTAAWYWASLGCNAAADAGDVEAITRKINGPAMVGLAERRQLFEQARKAFA